MLNEDEAPRQPAGIFGAQLLHPQQHFIIRLRPPADSQAANDIAASRPFTASSAKQCSLFSSFGEAAASGEWVSQLAADPS